MLLLKTLADSSFYGERSEGDEAVERVAGWQSLNLVPPRPISLR